MRARYSLVVLMADLLLVIVSAFYAVFLVHLIEKIADLDGVAYWVALSTVFAVLLFFHLRYCSPSLIATSLGRSASPRAPSIAAMYLGVVVSSLFVSALIVQEIDRAFVLDRVISVVVEVTVFVLVFVGLGSYVRTLRRSK